MRWESDRRYYVAKLEQDLMGDWVVIRSWGGRFNNLGSGDTVLVQGQDGGLAYLEKINQVRIKRRYTLVSH